MAPNAGHRRPQGATLHFFNGLLSPFIGSASPRGLKPAARVTTHFTGADDLDMEVNEHVGVVLEAMKSIASQLGLEGSPEIDD